MKVSTLIISLPQRLVKGLSRDYLMVESLKEGCVSIREELIQLGSLAGGSDLITPARWSMYTLASG